MARGHVFSPETGKAVKGACCVQETRSLLRCSLHRSGQLRPVDSQRLALLLPPPPLLLFMAVDSGDPSISIPVGIVIGLLASFIQSLGLTIQRKSHVLNQSLPEDQQKVEHRRPYVLPSPSTISAANNVTGYGF